MNSIPEIHIGILKSKEIEFKLEGVFTFKNQKSIPDSAFKAFIENDEIVVAINKKKYTFKNEAIIIPSNINSDVFELTNVVIGVNFHWEQKENQKFQGALKLLKIEDEIQVINIIPIENYLISVISSEMNANCSVELLKAHAIISRSWLLAQIEKQKELSINSTNYTLIKETDSEYIRWYDREDHHNFHVCADDHCQRYQGITKAHNPNVANAVNKTTGQILYYNHKICDARFSKCCGGISELFENCWEPVKHPYLTKVFDNPTLPNGYELNLTIEENAKHFIKGNPEAFCNTKDEKILSQVLNNYDLQARDFYRWKVEFTQEEISNLIKKKSGRDFGKIIDLIPIERGASGRLIKLKIIGEHLSLTIGKELEIRRWLSESHLYSAAFYIKKKGTNIIPDKFILHGAGWGHGVGLCQIGAAVMGEKGYSHLEILNHYFKNAQIKEAYTK